jgi:hypothetical protein
MRSALAGAANSVAAVSAAAAVPMSVIVRMASPPVASVRDNVLERTLFLKAFAFCFTGTNNFRTGNWLFVVSQNGCQIAENCCRVAGSEIRLYAKF